MCKAVQEQVYGATARRGEVRAMAKAEFGCGCGGGSSSSQKYEVTTPDGRTIEVSSRTEALALVRREGGSWKAKS
jgi:hypothetical protein